MNSIKSVVLNVGLTIWVLSLFLFGPAIHQLETASIYGPEGASSLVGRLAIVVVAVAFLPIAWFLGRSVWSIAPEHRRAPKLGEWP